MFNPRSTVVRCVSAESPEPAIIAEAAAVISRGGLVVFPTETVYGLGAARLMSRRLGRFSQPKDGRRQTLLLFMSPMPRQRASSRRTGQKLPR